MLSKKCLFLLLSAILMMSCSKIVVKKIGKLNMISNRNIDTSADYVLLRNYMGMSEDEIEDTECITVEDAIDLTVKNTPGGEYLQNIKLYLVKKSDEYYFAAEGDVWGLEQNANFRGFKVGDKVQWKSFLSTYTGVITSLKDAKECTVKVDGSDSIDTVEYDELLKIGE